MTIRLTTRTRTEAEARKVLRSIEECEDGAELDAYIDAEAELIEAIRRFDPAIHSCIVERHQTLRSELIHGAAGYRRAVAEIACRERPAMGSAPHSAIGETKNKGTSNV